MPLQRIANSDISLTGSFSFPVISGNTVIQATDNTNAALRITQLGTGNALVVEDSANPDSTPFVINSGGQVTVGHTSQPFFISGVVPNFGVIGTTNTDGGFVSARYSNDTSPAWLFLGKSRGSIGSQGSVSSGDSIGNFDFSASDGTIFVTAARIRSDVDGTPATGSMPGRLSFLTTASGSAVPTERMRIRSDGNISIGDGGSSAQSFRVAKNITGATSYFSVVNQATIQSDVTSTATYYYSGAGTAATSFTLGSLRHYQADQNTLGVGSAVTNQIGFLASSSLIGATNNFGFYSDIASGTGRWNFYANGTANNYFAGNVGIGTNNPTQQLTVGGSGNILVAAGGTVFSSGRLYIRSGSGQPFDFGANDTNSLMQLASSGSLGLGTTPSAWGVIAPGLDIGPCGGMGSFTNQFDMLYNLYYDGGQFRYKTTNTGLLYRQLGSDGHVFETCPSGSAGAVAGFTRKASINDFGIGLGAVTPTSGMGITFPATQDPSSNANTLDDYEEGTWTPTFTGSVSNPTVTYGDRVGRYTKIGNLVTVQCRIDGVFISGGSGQIRITGLPFTNASDTPTACIPMQQSTGINGRYSCAYLDPSINYFTMWNNDPNSGYSTHNYPVASTLSYIFNLSYRV
jgi:hypothetical protein